MNRACERQLLSRSARPTSRLTTTLIVCCLVAGCWLEEAAATPENPLPGQSSAFSVGIDYRFVAEVLTQLRANSREKGDVKLTRLLQRVRIAVPRKSLVEGSPNAYALSGTRGDWVLIEESWIREVAGLSELGALSASSAYGSNYDSFAKETYYKFCQRYQATYREAERKGQRPPVYGFRFQDFFRRSDSKWALEFVLFDKLAGVVSANAIVWTVLHEVGHHALKHTITMAHDKQTQRQRELQADKWAFARMKALGYSLFGVGNYFGARRATDHCLGGLGLVGDEEDSTHPTWWNREFSLNGHFDVFAAADQDLRVIQIPMGIPEPVLATVVIPDSSSQQFEAPIVQRGRVTLGFTEWDGKTARVYAREAAGGRLELIVKDAMRAAPIIEQRVYDQNNRLVRSLMLPGVQVDMVTLDFLEINGLKFSDLRKRAKGKSLMVVHLRRGGASESAIHQALAAADQYDQDIRHFGLGYVKGNISYVTFAEQIQKKANMYEQRLIKILGENRYRAYVESYGNEVKAFMPPMTGADIWEERVLKENFGK